MASQMGGLLPIPPSDEDSALQYMQNDMEDLYQAIFPGGLDFASGILPESWTASQDVMDWDGQFDTVNLPLAKCLSPSRGGVFGILPESWTASHHTMEWEENHDTANLTLARISSPPRGGIIELPEAAPLPPERNGQVLAPPKNPPTLKDWESYRSIFTKLYSTENKTLKEVRATMEAEYNFIATERMYKRKILKWNLTKNYKAADRRDVAQVVKFYQRRGEDCPKQITIGGRPVKMNRVWRHCKGEQLSPQQILKIQHLDQSWKYESANQVSLEDLRRMVSSSKPRAPLSTPATLRYPEILLSQTDILCESLYQLQLEENDKDKEDRTEVVGDGDWIDSFMVFDKIDSAILWVKTKQQKAAWRILHEGFDMMSQLFRKQNSALLEILLKNAALWPIKAGPDLFDVIWRFISDMASTKLGSRHPLSILCYSITQLEPSFEIYENAFQLMISKWKQTFPPHHKGFLDLEYEYLSVLRKYQHYETALSLQQSQLEYYESIDKYSWDSLWAVHAIGRTSVEWGNFAEAEANFRDLVQRCRHRSGELFLQHQIDIDAVLNLCCSLHNQDQFEESQTLLEEALENCLANPEWEPLSWQIVDVLGFLVESLEGQGKWAEAEKVKRDYPENFD